MDAIQELIYRMNVYEVELADARTQGVPDDAPCMVGFARTVQDLHAEVARLNQLATEILTRYPAI